MLTTKNYQEFQVLNESGTVEHTFSGKANQCLPGDFVEVTPHGITLKKRNQTKPLVGTIHIQSKYLFGHTSRNIPIYLFFPYDSSYPPMRVGCSARDGKNKIGLVLFDSWEKGETYPRGNLQQILGDASDVQIEELALKYNYAPDWKKIAKVPESAIHTNRFVRSQFNGFTFNIDPPGCKDIDDCLTLQREGDIVHLTITIADLYEIVDAGSELDQLASKQGSTLYSPEGEALAPMLPKWISEGKASLIPGEKRNGISLSMIWDKKELKGFRFYPSTIINEASYTYDSVYENKEICEPLTEIASYLQGSECLDSHKWIEHMMILYNKKVAELFLKRNTGLLRKLDSMSFKRLEQKAAEYCLPTLEAKHIMMGNTYYTHATSPIRRYADILAQRYLYPLIWLPDESIEVPSQMTLRTLNKTMKGAARFQRDLCFLKAVSKSTTGAVEGKVLDWIQKGEEWKIWVEVPEWNQIISFRMKGREEGDELVLTSPDEQETYTISRNGTATIKYYCNRDQPNWKKRMVFGF